MNKKETITVKHGGEEITFKRDSLSSCNESSDGIVFQLKNKMIIQCNDNYMLNSVKAKVKQTLDMMTSGCVYINLDNPKNPIKIEVSSD